MINDLDLSISIVNWNTHELLDQCLDSIFTRVRDVSFEVIVVDNASSDESADMVRRRYPQVKLIENSENVGFAKANNQAYAVSQGRHFMLLNSDTVVLDDLAPVVKFLDENADVGVVGCKCLNPDGSIQKNWNDHYPSLLWEMLPEGLRDRVIRRFHGRELDSIFDTKWVGGQCMTVSRKCIEHVGVMDDTYFMYTEETDWCFRIRKAGWRVCHFPGISVIHYGGQSTKQDNSKMLVELYRSKVKFIRCNYSSLHSTVFKVSLYIRSLLLWAAVSSRLRGEGAVQKRSRIAYLLQHIPKL